ncbi:S8 family peptidase [Phaeobacter sp. JH18-32]|uniref:S8 family peptidase n=1 Tax=Phaeobacter TaxID=302485 RepID=UPI003A8AE095
MASRYGLPHQFFTSNQPASRYRSHSQLRTPKEFDREAHSDRLLSELNKGVAKFKEERPEDDRLGTSDGVYLEVVLRSGSSAVDVLQKNKMEMGATKVLPNGDKVVGLYVPQRSLPILHRILDEYGHAPLSETSGKPPNQPRVEAIDQIRAANFLSFWNDDRFRLPEDEHTPIWWEVWCAPDHEADLETMCATLDVAMAPHDSRLRFPESVVVPVRANKIEIELVLFARFTIQELRRADDTPAFYMEDCDEDTQLGWIESLAQNVIWPDTDVPYVSILDTGVNRAHDLIEPALTPADLYAINDAWQTNDTGHRGLTSHGTQMASLALHGDLTNLLSSTAPIKLEHRLESVKIIPPRGFPENEERSLGRLNEIAVLDPEAAQPDYKRIHCLATSNKDRVGSQPSQWSAAIDRLAAGALNEEDDTEPSRLFVVSTGNTEGGVQQFDDQQVPLDAPILDPAQAWNALSIGGYTDKVLVQGAGTEDMRPVAEAGALSPHTRTSVSWNDSQTPFKPEVVFEAGNKAVGADGYVYQMNALDLLAAGPDMAKTPLATFRATSAATALGARTAAIISARNPDLWPETVRALIVHSAEWTEPMRAAFERAGNNKTQAKQLLRAFGYGVPDIDRACASAKNHVALIAQQEIQPFVGGKMGYCDTFDLPWPRSVLESMGGQTVSVKVTLSYFVEPNPGRSASVYPSRYQSYGLRFDLRRVREGRQEFLEQTNKIVLGDKRKPEREKDSGWRFGSAAVSAGSLHCDVWTGEAAELLTRDMLCVYPVAGWWKHSKKAGQNSKKARYALVVSIKSDDVDVDLHTPIKTVLETGVQPDVDTLIENLI